MQKHGERRPRRLEFLNWESQLELHARFCFDRVVAGLQQALRGDDCRLVEDGGVAALVASMLLLILRTGYVLQRITPNQGEGKSTFSGFPGWNWASVPIISKNAINFMPYRRGPKWKGGTEDGLGSGGDG